MYIKIECPFNFGDKVYFVKKEWKYGEIECPFCHGDSTIDTGITAWKPKIEDRRFRLMPEYVEKPLILKCKSCDSTGKIKVTYPPVSKKIYGVLTDIKSLHCGGWECIEYIVTDNDGNEYTVLGRDIHREN